MRTALLAILALACTGGEAPPTDTAGDTDADTDADTDSDTDTDTDTDTDADTDTDSDTDTDTDTAAPPAWTSFSGTVEYVLSGSWECEVTVTEAGTRIDASHRHWAVLTADCPSCTDFFEALPAQERACDDRMELVPQWRGLAFDGATVTVRMYSAPDRGDPTLYGTTTDIPLDDATLDYGLVQVSGPVTFTATYRSTFE